MNKLLIVDDEPLIQVGIKSMLDWEHYDIEIIGTASNGKEAFDFIKQTMPDIVIADIKMPIMDGLSLIKACKETFDYCPLFIILTSHEEFNLLKEAIQYDIVDYLVKLELTPALLLASIQKAQKRLDQNRTPVLTQSSSNAHFYHDKFFISLLHNLFETKDQFANSARTLNLAFDAPYYVACQCAFHSPKETDLTSNDTLSAYTHALEMLEELLPKYARCHIFSLGMNFFCVIFLLDETAPCSYRQLIESAFDATFSMIHNYFNVSVKASVGRLTTNALSICESFQDARQIYPYIKGNALLFFEAPTSAFPEQPHNTFNLSLFKEALCQAFKDYDDKILDDTLSTIIQLFEEHPTKYLQAIDGACNILYLSLSLLPDGDRILSKIFASYKDGYRSIYKQDTTKQITTWLMQLKVGLCQFFISERQNPKNQTINHVKKYIDEHIGERLSLPEVAAIFNISPNYLSLLFKKYSDIGFSEYISQQKIACAKKMLAEDKLKIYEIADCLGFENAFYFSKVFKKVTGCSPRYYKQNK